MDTKITTFIFDCFNVICPPVLSCWYRDNMVKRGFIDENFANVLKEFDLGNLSEEDVAEYFSKYEGINSTKEKIQEEIDSYIRLDDQLVDTILKLKEKSYKTALLTNANATLFTRKIYNMFPNFKNLFNEIVISSNVKMIKPDKDIFIYTLKKVNSKPEESVFIDDNKSNVDAAVALGMHGFVYTNNTSFSDYIETLGINLN